MDQASTTAQDVREHLKTFLAPVIEERDSLLRELAGLEARIADVREGLRIANGVIGKIEGTEKRPGPKKKTAVSAAETRVGEARVQMVRRFIEDHQNDLGEDFTIKPLMEAMGRNGGETPARSSLNAAIAVLYERGVLRRTRATQGGGFAYALTGGAPKE